MKTKLYKILIESLILIIIVTACNIPTTSPPSIPDPNVDLSSALVVNTYLDTFDGNCTSSDCSLRDAVYQANTTSADEILLPRGLYKLNERIGRNDDSGRYGDLDITSRIIIQGEGIDFSVIDGVYKDRIFHVLQGGSLTLYDLTLLNGKGDDPPFTKPKGIVDTVLDCVFSLFSDCKSESYIGPPSDFEHIIAVRGGGAIANSGSLILNQVTIEYNLSLIGGGIANYGTAEITGGRICNNQGRTGGAIYNEGNLQINGAQICDNNLGNDPADWPPKWSDTPPGFQNSSIWDWLPPYEFNSDFYLNGGGGGIYNEDRGTLYLLNSEISNNDANAYASALWNRGTATLEAVQIIENIHNPAILNVGSRSVLTILGGDDGYSIISGNEGPALINKGSATIARTLISNNSSYGGGAVVNLEGADLELSQSLISGNVGEYGPGGVAVLGGTVKLTNVSIGQNDGPNELNTIPFKDVVSGMGAFYIRAGQVEMLNVTIFDNNTYGLVQVGGRVTIRNTILANNAAGNCFGTITSQGYNLDSGETCSLKVVGDLSSTDPMINPILDASTRYTYTIPVLSPAHDAGDIQNCPAIDQQGEPRPMGFGCDIGADEKKEIIVSPLVAPESAQPPAIQPAEELAPPPTFTPTVKPPPTLTFTPHPPTPTLTPIPDPMNASITGSVWNDANGNGSKDGGETGLAAQTVKLGTGACSTSGLGSQSTNLGGGYSFTGLAGGTYCVSVEQVESCGDVTAATTPKQVTITLQPGGTIIVSFGFQKVIC